MRSLRAHVSTVHFERQLGVSAVHLGKFAPVLVCSHSHGRVSQSKAGFPANRLSFSSFSLEQRSLTLSRCGRLVVFQAIRARVLWTEQMVERGCIIFQVSNVMVGARNRGQDKGRKLLLLVFPSCPPAFLVQSPYHLAQSLAGVSI